MLPEADPREGVVSHEQYRKVRDLLPAYARIALVIGYHTGARKGEVTSIRRKRDAGGIRPLPYRLGAEAEGHGREDGRALEGESGRAAERGRKLKSRHGVSGRVKRTMQNGRKCLKRSKPRAGIEPATSSLQNWRSTN
jgi:hypothetical protein